MSFISMHSCNRKSRAVRPDLLPRNRSILANIPRQVYLIHILRVRTAQRYLHPVGKRYDESKGSGISIHTDEHDQPGKSAE